MVGRRKNGVVHFITSIVTLPDLGVCGELLRTPCLVQTADLTVVRMNSVSFYLTRVVGISSSLLGFDELSFFSTYLFFYFLPVVLLVWCMYSYGTYTRMLDDNIILKFLLCVNSVWKWEMRYSYHNAWSALSLNFHKCIRHPCIYKAQVSPVLISKVQHYILNAVMQEKW